MNMHIMLMVQHESKTKIPTINMMTTVDARLAAHEFAVPGRVTTKDMMAPEQSSVRECDHTQNELLIRNRHKIRPGQP